MYVPSLSLLTGFSAQSFVSKKAKKKKKKEKKCEGDFVVDPVSIFHRSARLSNQPSEGLLDWFCFFRLD